MKVLVTGGAGFIGSHIVDALCAAGHQVVVVDNLSTGRRQNLRPDVPLHPLDLRSPDLGDLIRAERPECICHQAAQASVSVSVKQPLLDAEINVLGSLRLLEAARQAGVRKIVYASSGGAVYGEPRYLPCDEDHPIAPLSPYGVSKYIVELYLRLYRDLYGLAYTVLRYANVYGPRQDPYGEAGVVAIFTCRMLRGQRPTIFGDGEQQRDFVYVTDVARANLLALTAADGQVLNIGSGRPTTVNTLYQHLSRLTGFREPPVYGPPRPGDVYRTYVAIERARHHLGWQPTVDLETGLAATVAAFRQGGCG